MIPGNTPQEFFGAAAAAATGAAEPGLSVRFNSADSAYLSRTPASAGNRKTFTWSGWVKRSKLAANNYLLGSASNSSNYAGLFFNSSDQLSFVHIPNANTINTWTNAVFRDVSAWYHVVVAVDTTQSTGANGVKIYVNNVQQTLTIDAYTQNADTLINSTNTHGIGALGSTFIGLDGYLALVHFIDGQALTPSSFGETSATTGQWIAKTYSGSYGTNGFFLDFLDNSAATATTLGKDSSGNNNNWTPVNLLISVSATNYSVRFDGNGARITASNALLALGTGDWTVECYLKIDPNSINSQAEILGYTGNNPAFEYDNGWEPRWLSASSYPPSLTKNVWYHIAWTRSGGTGRIFVDGALRATVANSSNFSNTVAAIGSRVDGSTSHIGWISNLRVVVGTALYTSSFTRPKIPLAAVPNTRLLTCQSSTIVDNSGNNIALTTVGSAAVSTDAPTAVFTGADVDSLRDHPTSAGTSTGLGGEVSGNYCTINPLTSPGTAYLTISNGNLDQLALTETVASTKGTIGVRSGKWYWEVRLNTLSYGGVSPRVGICRQSAPTISQANGADEWIIYMTDYPGAGGRGAHNSTTVGTDALFSNGDIGMFALDMDNSKIYFGKNGTWLNSGNPVSGTGAFFTDVTGEIFPLINTGYYTSVSCNFGQRAWSYPAPSGFSPLVDTLLPTPTIALPNTVMDVKLYTGNGSSQSITGLGFSPDLVWLKARSTTAWHEVFDSVRGALKHIFTNDTAAESTLANTLTSFDSNGFSLGSDQGVNWNTVPFVAWTWDAGSSNATNTSGTITSTVRANISAGFSIVTYTGGGAGSTIGHGLGVAPCLIIVKDRGVSSDWCVYHVSTGAGSFTKLNTTNASAADTTMWGNTTPSSTTFTWGYGSGSNYVAYCWTPVAGYSAFGSYTGNGSSDGPFVYTGFRPRWVMVKRTDSATSANWTIVDTARDTYNVVISRLFANLSDAEITNDNPVDILSNGFKLRTTSGNINASGGTFIYACFAESPLPYARAR